MLLNTLEIPLITVPISTAAFITERCRC